MDNILNSLMKLISPRLVSSVSSALGAPEASVSKGLTGIVPVVLSGVLNKSEDPQQLNSMVDMLKKVPTLRSLGGTGEDQFKALTGNSEVSAVSNNFLNTILGDKSSGVVSLLSQFSGLNTQSSSSLMKVATPLVMGFLGNKLRQGASPTELVSALKANSGSINKMLPGGMQQLFAQPANPSAVFPRKPSSGLKLGWLKWLIGVIVLLFLVSWLLRSCGLSQMSSLPSVVTPSTTTTAPKVVAPQVAVNTPQVQVKPPQVSAPQVSVNTTQIDTPKIDVSLGQFISKVLPDNVKLNIPSSGTESKLLAFIQDNSKVADANSWFVFDRLNFETGSAVLKPNSSEQLKNIAEILRAYPQVNIELGGYTDHVGDEAANLNLSQARANSVKQNLVQLGISADRIDAKGYGSAHPIASNDTPEGRAKNRRIDILVTKK